ncbi:cyclic lactone autoinducer peptide [Tissierella carlieri]|uniref:Cyclic lactone autoinducer peptide n=1 Tax=Tissierella carlieri TaxID=689904 RepID=A0ABT1SFV1_9FIRM|nr:cyclic lactone autoinducer peptide [Tissierella carlieri]MCQ4925361.1 cyclic lactone autoinducer peptide [Tissierella carlieri]
MKKLLKRLCNFLVLLAPLAMVNIACLLFWGEPECPDALKSSIPNK